MGRFEFYPIDVLTSSGKYKDRERSDECTTEVRTKAADTAERVTKLLNLLGIEYAEATSGFRTSSINASTGGAKRSAHMTGEAVDLADTNGSLASAILNDKHLLDTCDLYMEDPAATPGWVHLQTRRTASGNRIFKP